MPGGAILWMAIKMRHMHVASALAFVCSQVWQSSLHLVMHASHSMVVCAQADIYNCHVQVNCCNLGKPHDSRIVISTCPLKNLVCVQHGGQAIHSKGPGPAAKV